jgi:hypothetical protein
MTGWNVTAKIAPHGVVMSALMVPVMIIFTGLIVSGLPGSRGQKNIETTTSCKARELRKTCTV